MNTQNKLFTALNINLEDELSDFFNSGHDDLHDFAQESANGGADVIYYSRAESLYNSASMAERDEAESMVEDCGGFGDGADMRSRFVALAYWITHNRLTSTLRDQCAALIESLEEAAELPEVRRLWGEVIDETVETLETI
tara:strand:- start:94 stop:513 length:420 start_codon:yes stop_codon:yes gene_type:complete